MVVGLTGGIGTGKSTVANVLRQRGFRVIDADVVARRVVEPGEPALARIVAAFGPDALGPDGRLDRARMRERITADPRAKKTLERITHPAIRRSIHAQVAALGEALVFVEAALMVETGSYKNYAQVIVVTCEPDRQVERVMKRDRVDEARARAIIAAQLPMAEKVRVATHVIENNGDLGALERRVDEVLAAMGRQAA